MSDTTKITITLTGRKPVKIVKPEWPIIAEANDSDHDGEVECQANRKWSWRLAVRQHADGRVIVYGVYRYSSNWQNERSYDVRGGQLLADPSSIEAAIQEVGAWMEANSPEDGERFAELTRDCLADLPAEEL